jgi:hypothetical protein
MGERERERVDANGFLGEYQENERKRMLWVYFNVIGRDDVCVD